MTQRDLSGRLGTARPPSRGWSPAWRATATSTSRAGRATAASLSLTASGGEALAAAGEALGDGFDRLVKRHGHRPRRLRHVGPHRRPRPCRRSDMHPWTAPHRGPRRRRPHQRRARRLPGLASTAGRPPPPAARTRVGRAHALDGHLVVLDPGHQRGCLQLAARALGRHPRHGDSRCRQGPPRQHRCPPRQHGGQLARRRRGDGRRGGGPGADDPHVCRRPSRAGHWRSSWRCSSARWCSSRPGRGWPTSSTGGLPAPAAGRGGRRPASGTDRGGGGCSVTTCGRSAGVRSACAGGGGTRPAPPADRRQQGRRTAAGRLADLAASDVESLSNEPHPSARLRAEEGVSDLPLERTSPMRRILPVAAVLALALTTAACGSDDADTAATSAPATTSASATPSPSPSESMASADIVDTAVAAGDFTTLAAALEAAGLVETLKGAGPFTVFAPTDEAFAKLPAGTVDTLLKDPKGDLTPILTYHVVPGKVMAADVRQARRPEGQDRPGRRAHRRRRRRQGDPDRRGGQHRERHGDRRRGEQRRHPRHRRGADAQVT